MSLAADTSYRLSAAHRRQLLAAWVALAARRSRGDHGESPELVAASSRGELAALLRDAFARRMNTNWQTEGEAADLNPGMKLNLSTIDSCDVPQFLADAHQLLLGYELLPGERGAWRARRCSRQRRQGGVFYTPRPIAAYIVRRTLDPLLERTDPASQQQHPLAILDPACGAGSFLLAALDRLLDWYRGHGAATPVAEIAARHLHGVDVDGAALQLARFNLRWYGLQREAGDAVSANLICGDALTGRDFRSPERDGRSDSPEAIDWPTAFAGVQARGGFQGIVANPPYRRELDHGRRLAVGSHPSLACYRMPRMDLWYYFAHRAFRLLHAEGRVGFITNSYWLQAAGAGKLREALRNDVSLEELFLLGERPIFPGVTGRHAIFIAGPHVGSSHVQVKQALDPAATWDQLLAEHSSSVEQTGRPLAEVLSGTVNAGSANAGKQSARFGRAADDDRFTTLGELGLVRQGIAENPATINRRTNARFGNRWQVGQGVFALSCEEVERLQLSPTERQLLRPYSQPCDLGRYRFEPPARWLIYSTRRTWPVLEQHPALAAHLAPFRTIMEARRETTQGKLRWWHLHWPRDERLWQSPKLLCLQFAERPSIVPVEEPAYVPFSVNVFVPAESTREHLYYFAAVLNSEALRPWFVRHGKRRGVGLEINGHLLRAAPIRRIDFDDLQDRAAHDRLVELVQQRMLSPLAADASFDRESDREIDAIGKQLYGNA